VYQVVGRSRAAAPVEILGEKDVLGHLAANRFGPEGLYILDEPEAALSVTGALAVPATVVRAARSGAQFIIATHSPVLLPCPDARIFELDDTGIAQGGYDDLEVVGLTRGFLDAHDRYLRAALEPADLE
jgi:predicted ATPase